MLDLQHLAELYETHRADFSAKVRNITIGGREFDFEKAPALMGVINLSPDSWYRESVCLSADAAIERGLVLRAQGADIVDLGAESTLLDAERVSEEVQNSKLLPVISTLSGEGVIASVETYHPEVAEAGLKAGAKVINLTGCENAEPIYRMAAEHGAAVIICHVAGRNVREVGDLDLDADPHDYLHEYFARKTESAVRCGLENLFIDPGLGFYYRNLADSRARIRHQTRVFLNTFRLRKLGFPVCNALPHAFEFFRQEVRTAEPFFAVIGALGKTDLFRTHEVSKVKAVIKTTRI